MKEIFNKKNTISKILAATLIIILVIMPFVLDSGLGFSEADAPVEVDCIEELEIPVATLTDATPTDGIPSGDNISQTYYYAGGEAWAKIGSSENVVAVKVDNFSDIKFTVTEVATETDIATKLGEKIEPYNSSLENYDKQSDGEYYYAWYMKRSDGTTYDLAKIVKVERTLIGVGLPTVKSWYTGTVSIELNNPVIGYIDFNDTGEGYLGAYYYTIVDKENDIDLGNFTYDIGKEGEEGVIKPWTKITEHNLSGISLDDGNYKIVIAYMNNDYVYYCNLRSFGVDKTPPESVTVTLQELISGTWTDIDSDKVLIPSNHSNYRYLISASDSGSGMELNAYSIVNGVNIAKNGIGFTSDPNTYEYYIRLEASDGVYRDITCSGTVLLEDEAGNEAQVTLPTVKFWDEEIKYTLSQVDGNNYIKGGVVQTGVKTNKPVKIKIKAESEINISDFLITGKETSDGVTNNVTYYDQQGLDSKTVETTITIPANVDFNNIIDDIIVHVNDGIEEYDEPGNPDTRTITLKKILYDITKPTISDNDATNEWSNNLSPEFTFKDEIYPDEESGMNSCIYTISNSINNVSDVNIAGVNNKKTYTKSIDIPESLSTSGTKIEFTLTDVVGNTTNKSFTYYVDKTKPTTQMGLNDKAYLAAYTTPINGTPIINYEYSDNLTIKEGNLEVVCPNGKKETAKIGSDNLNGSVKKDSYSIVNKMDGKYTVTLKVTDKAGNESAIRSFTFVLDNTLPVLDNKIVSGVSEKATMFAGKYLDGTSYGYYYKGDVGVKLFVNELNFDPNGTKVFDNEIQKTALWTKEDGKWVALISISGDGRHNIVFESADVAGNKATTKGLDFVIDTIKPTVTTKINDVVYTENSELRMLQENATLNVSSNDTNKDTNDLVMTVTTTKPGDKSQVSTNNVAEGAFGYTEEADYKVNIVAKDRANNASANKEVNFRIDKTAPALEITGIANNGATNTSVTINYKISEAFHWDMKPASINVYKQLDGEEESLVKTLSVALTGRDTTKSETYSEDGVYRLEFEAVDRAGNSKKASHTFTIDSNAPVITLTGVKNYDKTKEDVTLGVSITENFFKTNKVVLSGSVLDANGKSTPIDFGTFAVNSSKVSEILRTYKEDGIYDISVTSTDKAGNTATSKITFTIDKTAPSITGLDEFDGAVLSEFKIAEEIDKFVKDLTVCNVKIYLDGIEYTEGTEVLDGKHILKIVAVDEMDHEVEKEISFTIDKTFPVIMITGAEDGVKYYDELAIDISLQLSEDELTKVSLNGKEIEVKDNACSISITDKDKYELTAEAKDKAGNVTITTISFEYANKTNWLFVIGCGVGGLSLLGILILVIKKIAFKK